MKLVAHIPSDPGWRPHDMQALMTVATLLLAATVWSPPAPAAAEPVSDPEWLERDLDAIRVLMEQARLPEAQMRAERLLEEVRIVRGERSLDTAEVLRHLVYCRLMQGKPADEETLGHALRVLEIFESTLGRDAPGVAVALNDAGLAFQAAGQYAKAVPLFERAVGILLSRNSDDPRLAMAYTNLAGAVLELGDYPRARALYESVLRFYESKSLPDDLTIAKAMVNMAAVMLKTGDLDGARPLVERSLRIFETSRIPPDPSVASGLNNLANVLKNAGERQTARKLYEHALEIDELLLGPEDTEVALVTKNLGVLDLQAGDLESARTRLERALVIYERNVGPRHPETVKLLESLAWAAYLSGESERAMRLVERSLPIREMEWNPEHPDVALDLYLLGLCHEDLGQFETAIGIYTRALSINEKSFGPDHRFVAENLVGLALANLRADRTAAAEAQLHRALSIFGDQAGSEAASIMGEAWLGLSVAAARRGERVRAVQNLDRAETVKASAPSEKRAALIFDRARYHALIGEPTEAIQFLRQAVAGGYVDPRMNRHPDLRLLHGDPDFEAIVALATMLQP